MTQLTALLAITLRNLRIAIRRPDLLVQTMAVPVVVLGLASIIFGGTDAWPIAVIDRSHGSDARAVVTATEEVRGATGPYFRTITTDPRLADRLLREGRIQLVLTIPEGYPADRQVEARTFNINTDAMKNVRLRLTTMANLHDRLESVAGVTARIDKARPDDVTRAAFMGGSAVILALLLGSALIAANLFALDTEHRTRKEVALTPVGGHQAAAGAVLAGWILSLATAVPIIVLALAFGTRASLGDLGQAALVVLPSALTAAAVGVLAAMALRTHRLIQPTLILLALGSYFASGGFMPVSALPPLARGLATWWPPAYTFEWSNPVLHGVTPHPASGALVALAAAAVVTVLAALLTSRRHHLAPGVQGQ
ncbi:ABC transporter permease [Intrasporangium sp.]|uniref:ABC transporter permease n=1 Tax=Intrasporangium sp. TaxID=1925024 RepID=UPI00293B2C86|nr:ABC transporter permease [Intrasporangium sp.]MDV3222984.1 ABC transporter permease [Intrasporangium sp.]